ADAGHVHAPFSHRHDGAAGQRLFGERRLMPRDTIVRPPETVPRRRERAHAIGAEGHREHGAEERGGRLGPPVTPAASRPQQPRASRPPFLDRRSPESVASNRWWESDGLTATASAPPMNRPSFTGSQRAPWSRERNSPPHALGSWAAAEAEQSSAIATIATA